jgi:hypothetical protein
LTDTILKNRSPPKLEILQENNEAVLLLLIGCKTQLGFTDISKYSGTSNYGHSN